VVQILLVFVVLCFAVFHLEILAVMRQVLTYVVASFTVFSGFHYSVVVARRLHQS
jgi:hypothetical protein